MKRFTIIILMCMGYGCTSSGHVQTTQDNTGQSLLAKWKIEAETKRIEDGEFFVLDELIRANSHAATKSCDTISLSSLFIGLLGTNKSDIATDTLIKLLSLRLDANNYERFRGFIILRGDSLVDRLEQLNPWQMARYCRARVQELRDKGYWKDINDVTMEQVCRSETEITQKTEALLKAIKSGVACKPAGCGEPSESQQN
jgi:hypothetical protein